MEVVMGASKELIETVVGLARRRLEGLGFSRRGEVDTIEVAPDILGSVGLNRAVNRSDDRLRIRPVLGVRHQGVEREVARLCGETFHRYKPPTLSAPLGKLTRRGEYVFEDSRTAKLDGQVARMVDAITTHGASFFEAHASIEAVTAALEAGYYGIAYQVIYRLPIALLSLDRRNEAVESLRTSLEDLGERDDDAAQRFRGFANAFIQDIAARKFQARRSR